MLHRIVIEFTAMEKIQSTIDIRSDGNIRYSLPSGAQGEVVIEPLKALEIIRDRAKALFLRENDVEGTPSEEAYHWKAAFYTKKGVIRTMEGWYGEPRDRFFGFEVLLSGIEYVTGEDFGAFAAEKKMREQQEVQRIDMVFQAAKEMALARSDPASNAALRISQKLLKSACCHIGSEENLMISPISIELILSLLVYASKGKTCEELLNYLEVGSDSILEDVIALTKTVANDRAASVATAIYAGAHTWPFVLSSFVLKLNESEGTDLLAPGSNAEAINKWVKDKTKGMIPSILSPEETLADLMVLNAVAFEAAWLDEYDDDDIRDGIFYRLGGGMEKAHYLQSTEDYLIYDESVIGFLKPYEDCGFSFMALLPQKTKDPLVFVDSLSENALYDLIRGAAQVPVSVTIPEFAFDNMIDLKEVLRSERVISVFDEKTADISNMLSLPHSYISAIKHKTHVEVDRKGTRAAAVTSYAVAAGLHQLPRFEVKLDRPFIFGIVHNGSGVPLFLGILNTLKGTA